MKIGVFWDVTPCGSCMNQRFGRTLVFLRSVHWLLVAASVVPSSPILVTLMKEALDSSETSVLARATMRNTQKTPFFKWDYKKSEMLRSLRILDNGGSQETVITAVTHHQNREPFIADDWKVPLVLACVLTSLTFMKFDEVHSYVFICQILRQCGIFISFSAMTYDLYII
jgi:hypothetical protein